MKQNVPLLVSSLLSVLLTMIHLADDCSRGFSPGGISNLAVVLVLTSWLYVALMLGDRRAGHLFILAFSLLASGLPVVHMMGRSGITGGVTSGSAGALFFAATLLALGVTALLSALLSARGLWSLRRSQPRSSTSQTHQGGSPAGIHSER